MSYFKYLDIKTPIRYAYLMLHSGNGLYGFVHKQAYKYHYRQRRIHTVDHRLQLGIL